MVFELFYVEGGRVGDLLASGLSCIHVYQPPPLSSLSQHVLVNSETNSSGPF